MKLTFGQRFVIAVFKLIDTFIRWDKLPRWLGVLNILAFRYELRAKNLHDTYPDPAFQGTESEEPMEHTKFLCQRNSDGKFNDLKSPKMGCAGMRFGRNVPRKHAKKPTEEELMTPNPRIVSQKLLARREFQPATIVNLLAAAWIQFQVHDWAQHRFNEQEEYEIPLAKSDPWTDKSGKMSIFKTRPDMRLPGAGASADDSSPGYENTNTHWWDGSQIYGSTEAETTALRSKCHDGQLEVDPVWGALFLPLDKVSGIPRTGFSQNWWLGLELLHTLFALEHNAIAVALKAKNPKWTSDQLFDTARVVNCALMAKIHTVEWTPAILQHPALKLAMDANWWGIVGEKLWKMFGRVSKSEAVSGILGSGVDHNGAPYCLTEEFVSVYRLHPLIPDDIAFFDIERGAFRGTKRIADVAFEHARSPFHKPEAPGAAPSRPYDPTAANPGMGLSFADILYSFGINYPGAITIHNTPDFLRDLNIPADEQFPGGRHLDMGTVDILRDRERGVPRYNAFRRLFHMAPAKSYSDLVGGDKKLAAELEEVYGKGNIEKVDLLVGCLAERPLPSGFGFSDTAFRVFILMASRRLKSDRFLAGDAWCPEVYTHEGIDWVQNNTMKDVLCRHFPELRASLRDVGNAFWPWTKVGESALYKGKETNKPEDVEPLQQNGHMVNGVV